MISVPLEPCPFCGCDPGVSKYDVDEETVRWAVGCNCENAPDDQPYAERYVSVHGNTKTEAIAAWNRRAAAPSPAGGRMEALAVAMFNEAWRGVPGSAWETADEKYRDDFRGRASRILAALSHPVSGGGEGHGSFSPEGAKIPTGVYVASRASSAARPAMWRSFREAGAPIVSTWIDEAGEGETACNRELWQRIEREVTGATALIFYAEAEDFPLKGALVEVGMALAAGVPVVVVTPGLTLQERTLRPLGSWAMHPLVTFADTVQAAFDRVTPAPADAPSGGA